RGTPTMGGTLLILSALVSCLLWCDLQNPFVWLTLGITACYTVIGFLDDYWKLRDKSSGGMPEKGKLISQLATAGLFMGLFFTTIAPEVNYDLQLNFPFVKPEVFTLELPAWLYATFATLVVFATSTALNLTDGLDGLAIGPTIVSSFTFGVLAYLTGATLFGNSLADWLLLPKVVGVNELSVLCAAIAGASIGFLWYNTFPAQVFMGDVGALPLGGALGAIAVFTKHEILSVIVHGIFVLEFLSVIIQRYSFKLTGKRVFAMAPIHHHFEKKGWPESRVTVRFWIISIVLALVAIASLKLR
ncbi:MAG: phospho-N-acetylmuramoyl-pentapeptide-transferase, partial [Myxococcales bacterium]|nr:phospho-N-acetylmuramoyl-pentapeptide-transferase [Myxococcales bacterium]